jgi:hypothetical protein
VDEERLAAIASRVRGASKTKALDSAAAEALDAFDAVPIRALLLKGVALARLLYDEEHRRGYSDVDILVGPEDVGAARRVLVELGYMNMTAHRGVDDVAGAVHADTWIRRDEEIGPLLVDLHFRVPGVQAPAEIAWDVLNSHTETIDVSGREAVVLAREGLALHVALHAAQHGPDHPRPLSDLEYAVDRWPASVWQQAAELARELDAGPAFAAGLRLVPDGARVADDLGLPPTDDLEWELHNLEARPRGTFHLHALSEARGLGARLRLLRRALFPPREWILWEDPLAHRGGIQMFIARTRHVARTPMWALKVLLYRRRARRRS